MHEYNPGFFPDEFAHMGYVLDVIKHGFPDYVTGTRAFDNKLNYLNHPALYYVIVGEVVNALHMQNMFAEVGRYINVLVSVAIIILTCKTLYKMTNSVLAVFLGGTFLLTVPMFIVLGSAVNNDQLNVLGCTLFIYGLIALIDAHEKNKSLTLAILYLCIGGVITAFTKATGSLAIVCILISIACFNFSFYIDVLKKTSLKQNLVILLSFTSVAAYYLFMYITYGHFYPSPQASLDTWFAIDNPLAPRSSLSDFAVVFFQSNIDTFSRPYGHVVFIDSDIRVALFKTMLIILGVMMIYVTVHKLLKATNLSNILFSFVFASFIFVAFYFYAIRQLHLNTGYPGALQARYFFGFLPVFSLMIGVVISNVNNRFITFCFSVLISLTLVASLYPALIKFSDPHWRQSMTVVQQPSVNTNYGQLVKGRTFVQEIVALSDSFEGAELLLATYARKNHGQLVLDLSNTNGNVIASSALTLESLIDNNYAWFDFKKTPVIIGQKYILRLRCNDCNQDNSITWWANKNDIESPVYMFTKLGPSVKGLYPQGVSYVDGTKVDSNFTFRLYF